jgi:hypothetical protein
MAPNSKNPPRGITRRASAQESGRLLPETPEGMCVLRAHAPHKSEKSSKWDQSQLQECHNQVNSLNLLAGMLHKQTQMQ